MVAFMVTRATPLGGGGRKRNVSTTAASGVNKGGTEWATMDELALIDAARTDRAAFGALYDRHFSTIYNYIVRRVGDEETAEDIAAAVWERALVAIERYEVRGVPFAAWLYRIAGNLVANHHRRRKLLSFTPFMPRHERGASSSGQVDDKAIVRQAMRRLSEPDQEVLGLCYFAGLTPPQIADALGVSVAAVHKRLHRARQRLRERLEGDSSDIHPAS